MLLKTKVIVRNVTNLSDARYCAGMGVDFLSFPIGNGNEGITAEVFKEISEWVAGPVFVLEYTDAMDEAELAKVTQMDAIQQVQLTYEQFNRVKTKLNQKPVILITTQHELISLLPDINSEVIGHAVLDQDIAIDWDELRKIQGVISVFVPYQKLTTTKDIGNLPIAGIVLEGTAEDKPGHKNYDELANVLETLSLD